MKALPFQIPKTSDSTILYQEDRQPELYGTFHKHPETQITLFISKGGTAYIDGFMLAYEEGDVFLVSGGVPHVFRSEENKEGNAHAVSLFLNLENIRSVLNLGELRDILQLLESVTTGIRFTGDSRKSMEKVMIEMRDEGDFGRLIKLLVLLKLVSRTGEYEILPGNSSPSKKLNEIEGKRMRDILEHSFNHYHENITLDDIAKVANMTTPAFCRYFKKRTRKSYITFLNEIRINAASRQLLNSDLNIAEICYHSGFTNLSNFNRFFKRINGLTPSQYRTRGAKL